MMTGRNLPDDDDADADGAGTGTGAGELSYMLRVLAPAAGFRSNPGTTTDIGNGGSLLLDLHHRAFHDRSAPLLVSAIYGKGSYDAEEEEASESNSLLHMPAEESYENLFHFRFSPQCDAVDWVRDQHAIRSTDPQAQASLADSVWPGWVATLPIVGLSLQDVTTGDTTVSQAGGSRWVWGLGFGVWVFQFTPPLPSPPLPSLLGFQTCSRPPLCLAYICIYTCMYTYMSVVFDMHIYIYIYMYIHIYVRCV
jgi:hypothetical protein